MHMSLAEQHHWLTSILRGHRLLRHAAQLPRVERVPPPNPAHLARLPTTAKPEEQAYGLGLVRAADRALPPPYASHHSPLDPTCGMRRVTSGKSRVRGPDL
jgi:hypothetical protein